MQRIRTRLIVTILVVAILPAIPLSIVVRNLLERSLGPTLDGSVERALEAGLAESRAGLRGSKRVFLRQVAEIWLPRLRTETPGGSSSGDITPVVVLDTAGEQLPLDPPPELMRWAEQAAPVDGLPQTADVVRVDNFLAVAFGTGGGEMVVLARPLPPEMVARAGRLTDALVLIRTLRQDRERVLQSYVAPFLLIYALLILAAVGAGALLARRIARPIESLVASTEKVAAGDLQARVDTQASGEIATLVAAFNRMVTRLAVQRRQLARLERVAAWRDLARTLAHEIKNPLTPILLAVQSARDGYNGEDPTHTALLQECEEIVSEEVEGLRNLVREFSEFARLPEPRPVPGDLNRLLAELVRLYGQDKVVLETPGGELLASFDASELRRALINLVENGLAACAGVGRPERVALKAHPTGDEVVLEVSDHGGGISPENQTRIFEPNFSTKKEGMGLGLCIVEGIVTGHAGSIAVASEVGSGSTFTIRLPRAAGVTVTGEIPTIEEQGGAR